MSSTLKMPDPSNLSTGFDVVNPLQCHHRHQASLEGIINFDGPKPLPTDQQEAAENRFHRILSLYQDNSRPGYNRGALLRHTYQYSLSRLSKDTFLQAFFGSLALDVADDGAADFDNKRLLDENITAFADLLLDNFYLPLKASGLSTPQPSPAHLSAIQSAQGMPHDFIATEDRLSYLRGYCLERDRHRCVVSRIFNEKEALIRIGKDGQNAKDVDGNPLQPPYEFLEVAHILPHSLMQAAGADLQLSQSKKTALIILNMFDANISHLIDGRNIDRPLNALTLTQRLHKYFGNFELYFTPVQDREHTYRIDAFTPPGFLFNIPVVRSLHLAEDRAIDAPSPRLLAIHRAIAHVLHLSGAGEYIDRILRDMEERAVHSDGSSELGRMVGLRFGGWVDGATAC